MINFTGICTPYVNKKGYYVIPIAKNPTQEEIELALDSQQKNSPKSGLNGNACFYGKDLVCKKFFAPQKAIDYNPQREIDALNNLYDRGIKDNQIQEGQFGLKTPDGQYYLVSSRVKGEKIDAQKNKFNSKNISELVKLMSKLDSPILNNELSKTNFPFEIPMHYDLHSGNILIDEENSGIIDFEYSKVEGLQEDYLKEQAGEYYDTNCNISDIAGLISNLRCIEYRSLINYIKEISVSEAKELFRKYLAAKSDYHKQIAQEYEIYADKNKHCKKISQKSKNHSKLLFLASSDKNYSDILKAEAMKIQIACFIYEQSPFSDSRFHRINKEQISCYVDSANEYFKQNYKKAIKNNDKQRENYYLDCIKVMKGYSEIEGWMDWQQKEPNKKEMSYMSDEEFEEFSRNHEKFMAKLTTKHITTLDEIVS